MPDSGFLSLSVLSLVVGVLLYLYPKAILDIGKHLNRTLTILDDQMVRQRYVVGLLAFIASYAFFKLALMLPALHLSVTLEK